MFTEDGAQLARAERTMENRYAWKISQVGDLHGIKNLSNNRVMSKHLLTMIFLLTLVGISVIKWAITR